MSAERFRFEPYDLAGGREWMLARGPRIGPQVILIAPLFEEMNFTRRLLAQLAAALAERGLGTWLPDLPGTGESARLLATIGWQEWRDAACAAGATVAAATGAPPFTCAFRGGALLDDAVAAAGRWRHAPVAGEALLRQLRRIQLVADREAGAAGAGDGAVAELAGYPLSAGLRAGLAAAVPAAVDAREVPAAPDEAPWRRAEPAGDAALAARLAADIHGWTAACAR